MRFKVKKVQVGLDAIAVVVLLFVVALGGVAFQQTQIQKWYQKYIDIAWEINDVKTRLKVSDRALVALKENCPESEVASK